jgi:photosystem II stability/assembly factor-like uncharacterized protein
MRFKTGFDKLAMSIVMTGVAVLGLSTPAVGAAGTAPTAPTGSVIHPTGAPAHSEEATESAWQLNATYPAIPNTIAITCTSTITCYAAGDNGSQYGDIVGTTNAGGTWTTQTVPAGTGGINFISCPSTTDCYAVGYVSSVEGEILATTNAGSSWTAQMLPAGVADLYGIACPSIAVCYAVGLSSAGYGEIIGTINGGSTWSVQTLRSRRSYPAAIACTSTTTCHAAGTNSAGFGVILVTSNAGKKWTVQPIPAGLYGMSAIACTWTTTCYAVGENVSLEGVVLTTTDGGSTWTVQTLPSESMGTAGISCPSTTSCYVVGDDTSDAGDILFTSDAGSTWTTQTMPAGVAGLFGISCPSATTCYSAGMKPSGGGAFILEGPFSIATTSLPGGTTDVPYTAGLAASGGIPPYTWSITAGSLPAGLSLNGSTGVISGDPTTAGTQTATVEVTDAEGWTASAQLSITIVDMTITTNSLPSAMVGKSYATTLTAVGGEPPYTWNLIKGSGTLPAGLRLQRSTGVISGVPNKKSESSTFTVEVRDAKSTTRPHTRDSATAALSIAVSSIP